MKQLDTDRLRRNLRMTIDDVEQALQQLSDTTGGQLGDLKSSARRQLQNARGRLEDMERHTAMQLRRTARQVQGYVRHHPWQVAGGVIAAAVALAMLSRSRHQA